MVAVYLTSNKGYPSSAVNSMFRRPSLIFQKFWGLLQGLVMFA